MTGSVAVWFWALSFLVAAAATLVGVLVAFWADHRIQRRRERDLESGRLRALENLVDKLTFEIGGNLSAVADFRKNLDFHYLRAKAELFSTELWEACRVKLADLGAPADMLWSFAGFFHAVRAVRAILPMAEARPDDDLLRKEVNRLLNQVDGLGREVIQHYGATDMKEGWPVHPRPV